MFNGTEADLKTDQSNPTGYLSSLVILAKSLNEKPDMVAGHSLGEFSCVGRQWDSIVRRRFEIGTRESISHAKSL